MPGPIAPISPSAIPDAIPVSPESAGGGREFQKALSTAIRDVEAFGQRADTSVENFLAGNGEELHTTILATQQASLAFDLFLQVRNKVVNAYQEVMKMQM
jgi:flagellar hook-basal body complex protein FliE